jgi:tRNA(His) 5'-end guanylyltransferase
MALNGDLIIFKDMSTDQLGKRMKEQYEMRTRTYLPRRTYTIIRLDGKAFHTFTRGLDKPFDEDLVWLMQSTTEYLCKNIQGCKFGYTQSDEISLLLTDFTSITTDAWFDGQIQKMVSVSASMATMWFNARMNGIIDRHRGRKFMGNDGDPKVALFDSRVFTIPDPIEVENYFIWRQKDAVRNSVSMLAQSLYSHKELHGKSQSDMQDMIIDKGENWNNLPDGFKRGRTVCYNVVSENWDAKPGNILKTGWKITTPDFLKNRDFFRALIPKINEL